MAGLAEYRTAQRDSFWTWRQLMYRFVDQLTPDDCFVIARQLYVEMLKAGYTAVGEFHYVHHQRGGEPYLDLAEMSSALLAAAAEAGIRIGLIPALYQQAGFGRRPIEPGGQQRFLLSIDNWLQLIETLTTQADQQAKVSVGAAFHSLRAVDLPAVRQALLGLRQIGFEGPIHMHVAEQLQEVDDCLRHTGRRPIELAVDELDLGPRWTLIHATHATPEELQQLASRSVVVAVCPTTEANLGDGIFPAATYAELGGRLAIGSDSHVTIDPRSELRLLEYAQRLASMRRVVLGEKSRSCGTWLCESAWRGGAQSLGLRGGSIAAGQLADLVILDSQHPGFAGVPNHQWLDTWVFAEAGPVVRGCIVGGKRVVDNFVHAHEHESRVFYNETIQKILGEP
jgi:formimidoylglutamate deiminase